MGKGYTLLLFVALALVAAMAATVIWGRGSKHGYGALPSTQPALSGFSVNTEPLQAQNSSPGNPRFPPF
jgi:hypothetical protein